MEWLDSISLIRGTFILTSIFFNPSGTRFRIFSCRQQWSYSVWFFCAWFYYLIKISGFASISFLIYSLVRPYVFKITPTVEEISRAKALTQQFGNSALDFFKTYSDKFIFAPSEINAYISYRVNRNFAVVLENPVAENSEEMKNALSLSVNIVMKMVLKKFITGCQKRVCPSIMRCQKRVFPWSGGSYWPRLLFAWRRWKKVYQKRPEQNKWTRLYDTYKYSSSPWRSDPET